MYLFSRLFDTGGRSVGINTAWGLAAIVASPTLAFGQFADVQQMNYWNYDAEIDAVVPLQLDSRVFRVELGFDMFDPTTEQLLDANGGGYLNLMFRPDPGMPWEWAIQNVYASAPDATWFEPGNFAYEFGSGMIPNGMGLFECELFVSLTEEPVFEEPLVLPGTEQWVFIEPANKIFTDEIQNDAEPLGDDYFQRLPWEQMFTRIGEVNKPDRTSRIACAPKNIPAVNEKLNECAPGATARSLGYLSMFYGFLLGTPELCIQCLHQEYVREMETSATDGTYDDKALSGRREVHGSNGRSLPVRSVDSQSLTNATSVIFGPAMDSVMDQIDHGHDVEISYRYKVNAKTYGHRAMVAKVERFRRPDGSRWYKIWTIDDNEQGDGKAANDLNCLVVNEAGVIFRWDSGQNKWVKHGSVDLFSFDQYRPRLADMNDDGIVNGGDLAGFLGCWGGSAGGEDDGDFNGDGMSNGADLAEILGNWGAQFER